MRIPPHLQVGHDHAEGEWGVVVHIQVALLLEGGVVAAHLLGVALHLGLKLGVRRIGVRLSDQDLRGRREGALISGR